MHSNSPSQCWIPVLDSHPMLKGEYEPSLCLKFLHLWSVEPPLQDDMLVWAVRTCQRCCLDISQTNYGIRGSTLECQRPCKSWIQYLTWQTWSFSQHHRQACVHSRQSSSSSRWRTYRAKHGCWPHGADIPYRNHGLFLPSFVSSTVISWLPYTSGPETTGGLVNPWTSGCCAKCVESGTFELPKLALWPVFLWISGAWDSRATVFCRAVGVGGMGRPGCRSSWRN